MLAPLDQAQSHHILWVEETIDEREAQLFNTHIMFNSQWVSVTIKAGDKVCQTCFSSLAYLMRTYLDTEVKHPDLPSLEEQPKRESAKEKLNRVFTILKMEKIRDEQVYFDHIFEEYKPFLNSRRIKQILHQIDDVYRHLQCLCDVLEHNDTQLRASYPYSSETNDSDELLNG
jgi:hypothetical protein